MPFEPVQFGKYTLYEKLAVGGMALIYRGRIQGVKGFQKDLVIKQILPQYSGMADFIDMFIDEAKIAVNLNHANIVPVYELGEIDGQLYIAMEYVAGRDLQAILEACDEKKVLVPPRIAAYVLTGVCRGLDYAHNKKDDATRQPLHIIHRDISPNNVIVSYEGEVKIIDFGIAKASIKVSVTQFGTLKGKMIYMSPEQAAEQKLDPRSDVFSAGILLYELVTGKKPYGGDNFAITQDNVKKAVFPPPDKVRPDLPPALTQIILKAMARDPKERFASAFDFERALTDFLFSTGQNVYARDVSAFMQELFADGTDVRSVEMRGKSRVKNLTDGGTDRIDTQPGAPSPGSLTPAHGDGAGREAGVTAAPADQTGAALLGDLPDEGDAVVDGTRSGTGAGAVSDTGPGAPAPEALPRSVPAPSGPAGGFAILWDEPFDFEIPPAPSAPETPSQRDTVVTRRLPRRGATPVGDNSSPDGPDGGANGGRAVPAAPPEGPTPAPAVARGGVVPAVVRGDPTRTHPSAAGGGAVPIAVEKPTDTTSAPGPAGPAATDLAGVVPDRLREEETAPGAAARAVPPPPVEGPRTPPPAPSRPGASATARPTPPREPAARPPRGVLPPRPASPETPVSPPGARPNPLSTAITPAAPEAFSTPSPTAVTPAPPRPAPPAASSPPRGTPAPPWQSEPRRRGILERITGRGRATAPAPPPPAAGTADREPVLEGYYDSPADFLENYYTTDGSQRGLFLSTTELDAKLGVDIPLKLQFANPPSSFVVHGRVVWRRAKEGTSKGKRLPAGLAIEFVEDLPDELEALFAYLGLP